MAINTKTIKRRIKSIGNTKKITKAMEMISAVKMRRAVANVLASRSYASLAWEMLTEIARKTDTARHPLLTQRPVKKIGLVLITSNRGLAGGFNSRLLQAVNNYIIQNKDSSLTPEVEVFLTGRQGKKIYHKFGHTVVAEFSKVDLTTSVEEVLPMAQMAVRDYMAGTYDRIVVAYTDYVSAVNQVPRIKQILPLTEKDPMLGSVNNDVGAGFPSPDQGAQDDKGEETSPLQSDNDSHYLFEPNTKEVLDVLLPRLVEMQMYQAILESDASEHSARMLAMRNASDAATDMIKELQNSFNKARQAAITQEISEIVGGAAALE